MVFGIHGFGIEGVRRGRRESEGTTFRDFVEKVASDIAEGPPDIQQELHGHTRLVGEDGGNEFSVEVDGVCVATWHADEGKWHTAMYNIQGKRIGKTEKRTHFIDAYIAYKDAKKDAHTLH